MSSTETEVRAAIIAEAARWIGTPFHHRQRCHGRGVDCVNLLIAVYAAVGVAPQIETPWYPHDWHMHKDDEMLVETLKLYARPVSAGMSGDIAVYGYGRSISHAAIIEDAANVIHAYKPAERVCRTERSTLESRLAAEWTARHTAKEHIASYWSVFPLRGCAAAWRIAA